MQGVHQVAAVGFNSKAEEYDRGRPDFPVDSIREVLASLAPGSRVLDLASGTGKLTRAMVEVRRNLHYVGVEPAAAMRAKFAENFPHIPCVDGTAASLPFPDGHFDAVFIGQAFHWFADEVSLKEIARCLKSPGGLLGNTSLSEMFLENRLKVSFQI